VQKNDFYIFVSRKFALLITLVQRYVFTKLLVSTAFTFRETGGIGRTDRRTDGRAATLNVGPKGGAH